jgi:hypothetical protein
VKVVAQEIRIRTMTERQSPTESIFSPILLPARPAILTQSLPPGRNGLTPNLPLSYSSGQGSNVSTVGYGWDVSIPFIQRINRTGTDAMFGQYLFYSTMDGELSSTTPGSNMYGARFEKGS